MCLRGVTTVVTFLLLLAALGACLSALERIGGVVVFNRLSFFVLSDLGCLNSA
jgi:hypothetical protein